MKKTFLFFTIAFLTLAISSNAQVTDIDGNQYKTVKIDTLLWMAENLNVSHFRNGDSIPEAEDSLAWIKARQEGKPAWCYYGSDQARQKIFYKLYNWYAVIDPRGLGPKGWHVASLDNDWSDLRTSMGGAVIIAGKMKSTSGWNENENGNNESGFSGLPDGFRSNNALFINQGNSCYWWSIDGDTRQGTVWCEVLNAGYVTGVAIAYGAGASVRLVKN